MTKLMDLTGQRFGRLIVLHREGSFGPQAGWLCRCDCGKKKRMRGLSLRRGLARSCGCFTTEAVAESNRRRTGEKRPVHARPPCRSSLPAYKSWESMLRRCYKPHVKGYGNYGGRGIRVCRRWHIFENFVADMGPRPSLKHTLDRIDNNKDYSTENCRWATWDVQSSNKRITRRMTLNGETLCLKQWAERYNMKEGALRRRLDIWKMPLEQALATPVLTQYSHKR